MTENASTKQGQASDQTHEQIGSTADRVKRDAASAASAARTGEAKLDAAVDRAEAHVHNAADAGARAARHTADKARDWRQRGSAAVNDVGDYASDLFDQARGYVRDNPAQSVAIALAAGWLVGRLMSRRH